MDTLRALAGEGSVQAIKVFGAAALGAEDFAAFGWALARAAALADADRNLIREVWALEAARRDQTEIAAGLMKQLYASGLQTPDAVARLIRWSIASSSLDCVDPAAEAALAHHPNHPALLEAAAQLALVRGDKPKAVTLASAMLALDGHNAFAFDILAEAQPALVSPVLTAQFTGLAGQAGAIHPTTGVMIHFALGRVHEAQGRLREAWAHFCQANAAQRRLLIQAGAPTALEHFTSRWDTALAAQQPLITAPPAVPSPDRPTPIFIVGAPRSGTTLLERVLRGHSAITGLGERNDIAGFFEQYLRAGPEAPARRGIALTQRAAWTQAYFDRFAASTPYILDKLPSNLERIAFIKALMPDAVFLNASRDARDTAVSLFTNNFGYRHGYSTDWDDALGYVHHARAVAAHWRMTGADLIEVCYESLVRDPRAVLEPLLARLGLTLEPGCLADPEPGEPVFTLSRSVVRNAIESSAIGRFRRFADAGAFSGRSALEASGEGK